MTVSELDEILTILVESEQVERYEAWQHTAYLSSLLANINRDPKQKSTPFTIEDFMPLDNPFKKNEPPPKPQTWQEMKAEMQTFATMMNQGRG